MWTHDGLIALDGAMIGWIRTRHRSSIDRVWPGIMAAATVVVIEATTLGVDLWFVRGLWATMAAYLYAAGTGLLVLRPHSFRLHMIVMPASLMFWFGRAAGAFDRWLESGNPVLFTVMAPAVALAVMAGTLHVYAIRYIAAQDALQSHGAKGDG